MKKQNGIEYDDVSKQIPLNLPLIICPKCLYKYAVLSIWDNDWINQITLFCPSCGKNVRDNLRDD